MDTHDAYPTHAASAGRDPTASSGPAPIPGPYSDLHLILDPRAYLDDEATEWLLYCIGLARNVRSAWLREIDLERVRKPIGTFDMVGQCESTPIALGLAVLGRCKPAASESPPSEPAPTTPTRAALAIAAALVNVLLRYPSVLLAGKHQPLMIEAGRALRLLAAKKSTDALECLASGPSPEDVAERLVKFGSKVVEGADDQLFRRYLRAIGRLIQIAPSVTISGEEVDPVDLPPRHRPDTSPFAQRSSASGAVESILRRPIPQISLERAANLGEDDAPGEDQYFSPIRVARGLPGGDRVAAGKPRRVLDWIELRAVRSDAMELQVGRTAGLSPGEIADIGCALEREVARQDGASGVAALGVLSAFSGMDPIEAANLPFFTHEPRDKPAMSFVCLEPLGIFHLVRAAPVLRRPLVDPQLYRVPNSHNFQALPPWVFGCAWLRPWLASRSGHETVAGQAVVAGLKELFSARQSAVGNSASARNWKSAICLAARESGLGRPEQALLLGRVANKFEAAALSYYAPTARQASTLTFRAVAVLSNWLGAPNPQLPGSIEVRTGFVGDPRCPTDSAAESRVAELVAFNAAPRKGEDNFGEMVLQHHRYQAKFLEIAYWVTGARPHAGALDALVDAETFVIVDDKPKPGAMDKGHSSARCIPLCPEFQALVRAWRAHRLAVIRRLKLSPEQPAFFIVNADRTTSCASPAQMRECLPPTSLLSNAHRHYFRTHLDALGMPHHTLNRLLGHWGLGSEPGMRCSGRAPNEFSPTEIQILRTLGQNLAFRIKKEASQ